LFGVSSLKVYSARLLNALFSCG